MLLGWKGGPSGVAIAPLLPATAARDHKRSFSREIPVGPGFELNQPPRTTQGVHAVGRGTLQQAPCDGLIVAKSESKSRHSWVLVQKKSAFLITVQCLFKCSSPVGGSCLSTKHRTVHVFRLALAVLDVWPGMWPFPLCLGSPSSGSCPSSHWCPTPSPLHNPHSPGG